MVRFTTGLIYRLAIAALLAPMLLAAPALSGSTPVAQANHLDVAPLAYPVGTPFVCPSPLDTVLEWGNAADAATELETEFPYPSVALFIKSGSGLYDGVALTITVASDHKTFTWSLAGPTPNYVGVDKVVVWGVDADSSGANDGFANVYRYTPVLAPTIPEAISSGVGESLADNTASHRIVHVLFCGDLGGSLTTNGGHIDTYPTGTECANVNPGPAAKQNTIRYGLNNTGTAIRTVNQPGRFFTWADVVAPAGNFTITIDQQITSGHSAAYLWDIESAQSAIWTSACVKLNIAPVIVSGDVTFTVPDAAVADGATLFIRVSYDKSGLVGEATPVPANIVYDFTVLVNAAVVGDDPDGLTACLNTQAACP